MTTSTKSMLRDYTHTELGVCLLVAFLKSREHSMMRNMDLRLGCFMLHSANIVHISNLSGPHKNADNPIMTVY